jgi:hypothetical protein
MIARTAARFGLNYVWGLANFTAGVVVGAFVAGFTVGLFQ